MLSFYMYNFVQKTSTSIVGLFKKWVQKTLGVKLFTVCTSLLTRLYTTNKPVFSSVIGSFYTLSTSTINKTIQIKE